MIMCALASSAICGAASYAQAEEAPMTVSVAGLNLRSAAGAMAAMARIHSASDLFCGNEQGRVSLERAFAAQACARTMVGKTVSKLDEPRVTALYERRAFPAEAASPLLARR
jgi:UrcA family protein